MPQVIGTHVLTDAERSGGHIVSALQCVGEQARMHRIWPTETEQLRVACVQQLKEHVVQCSVGVRREQQAPAARG